MLSRPVPTLVTFLLLVFLLILFPPFENRNFFSPLGPPPRPSFELLENDQISLVPVTLYVMSQCPDAAMCESVFASVLAQTNNFTELSTEYVARIDPEAKYGVACKHGDQECFGNILELCFQYVYPAPVFQRPFLYLLSCLNRDLSLKGTHEYTSACVEETNLDYQPIRDCAETDLGRELLVKSVERTNSKHVTKSCTIYINGKKACVRDGGWYDCPGGHEVEDFVREIREAM